MARSSEHASIPERIDAELEIHLAALRDVVGHDEAIDDHGGFAYPQSRAFDAD